MKETNILSRDATNILSRNETKYSHGMILIVIVCKIPGDQSSRFQRCQGGQRLEPEAHSQAQLPAQYIINVRRKIQNVNVIPAETQIMREEKLKIMLARA